MQIDGEEIRREGRAYHCIGCGPDNPRGLHLEFTWLEPDGVSTSVTLDRDHSGWDGVAHGGIVSLILDEVASWCVAARLNEKHFATRVLTVRFLRPTPVGKLLLATAHIGEQKGPLVEVTADLRLEDGSLTARAQVEIIRFDEARHQRFLTELEKVTGNPTTA